MKISSQNNSDSPMLKKNNLDILVTKKYHFSLKAPKTPPNSKLSKINFAPHHVQLIVTNIY